MADPVVATRAPWTLGRVVRTGLAVFAVIVGVLVVDYLVRARSGDTNAQATIQNLTAQVRALEDRVAGRIPGYVPAPAAAPTPGAVVPNAAPAVPGRTAAADPRPQGVCPTGYWEGKHPVTNNPWCNHR